MGLAWYWQSIFTVQGGLEVECTEHCEPAVSASLDTETATHRGESGESGTRTTLSLTYLLI